MDIQKVFGKHAELVHHIGNECKGTIEEIAGRLTSSLSSGGAVFICGNGGSASQAEHFAGELLGRFNMDRKALPVFALSQNSAVLTSIANDTSYIDVFARQLRGIGKKGDCLIALSTSGGSENVVEACKTAKTLGMQVFTFTGESGGQVALHGDVCFKVPSSSTARIQEIHLVALHIICEIVEQKLFSQKED